MSQSTNQSVNGMPGSELSAAQQCPDVLLGTFNNYTVDKGSGAQCGGVGYFSVCDNHKNVTVDYGVCSEVLFYSSEFSSFLTGCHQPGSLLDTDTLVPAIAIVVIVHHHHRAHPHPTTTVIKISINHRLFLLG